VNRGFEQRLKRLEQKQSQALRPKKEWLPKWLTDLWSEDYGLPFDTQERGLDSLARIQKLKKAVAPVDDDCVIERLDAVSFEEARRNGNPMIPAGELRASIDAVHAAASCLLPTCRL
jgi:hypothetical protein